MSSRNGSQCVSGTDVYFHQLKGIYWSGAIQKMTQLAVSFHKGAKFRVAPADMDYYRMQSVMLIKDDVENYNALLHDAVVPTSFEDLCAYAAAVLSGCRDYTFGLKVPFTADEILLAEQFFQKQGVTLKLKGK